jgi:hypothetical protein
VPLVVQDFIGSIVKLHREGWDSGQVFLFAALIDPLGPIFND